MSIDISVASPSLKQLAEILRSIANLIENSSNPKISLALHLEFSPKEVKDASKRA